MIIAVNTRLLISGKLEGIGWFTFESLKRITRQHPEHQFIFIFDRDYSKEMIFAGNVKAIVAGPPTRHPVLWWYWFEFVIPKILRKHKVDLFLSPDGYSSLSTDVKTLIVMHDINFVHRPKDLPFLIRHYYNFFFKRFARNATRLATVSQFSKNDIAESFFIDKDKIDVVYNGAKSDYKPLDETQKRNIKNKYSGGSEFFVFVGALHPRKNVTRLLLAYDEFRKTVNTDVKLIIVGERMFKSSDIAKAYNGLKFKSDVVFSGRLAPLDLSQVLASALALTFVPLFEGFGIPVVEAFYCDTAVITSNVSSLPEVAGKAALLVDPFSIDSIKDAMIKISSDSYLKDELIANARIWRNKFTWDKTATKLWQSIEKTSNM